MKERMRILWLFWVSLFVGMLIACTFFELKINIMVIGVLIFGTIAGGIMIKENDT